MEFENEMSLLGKFGLSPDELLFVRILLIAREGLPDSRSLLKQYFSLPSAIRGEIQTLIGSLKSKSVILSHYKLNNNEEFKPHEVPISVNFQKNFFRSSFEMGEELYEAYPLSTIVSGVEYKLRRVSKKFDSMEQAFFHYGKAIAWSQKKHEEVLALIERGKESGYQFSTLGDFIVDRDWVNIEALNPSSASTNQLRMI